MPVGRPRPPWRTRGIDRLPRGLVCPDARRSRALDALHAAGVEVEELAREAATEAASETEWFVGEVHAEGEADRVLPETESARHKATPSNQRIP